MDNLSPIGKAIKEYKLNAEGGFEAWSRVPCAEHYRMHVPSMGFDVTGHAEVNDVIFGWLTDIGAQQELMDIVEFGDSVTCFLRITDKEGAVLEIVEVFQIDTEGHVSRNLGAVKRLCCRPALSSRRRHWPTLAIGHTRVKPT